MPMSLIGSTRLHCGVQSTPLAVSGVHSDTRCGFLELTITTDGAAVVTVSIYDNATAAAGKRIGNQNMVFIAATRIQKFRPVLPRLCKNGIYVELTCAGVCSASVEYDTGVVEG